MTERPSALCGTASGQEPTLNLLVTLDARYLPPLRVMLTSLLHANPFSKVDLYLLHSSLSEEDLKELEALPEGNRCRLHPIFMDDSRLEGAPISDPVSAGDVLSYFCRPVSSPASGPGAVPGSGHDHPRLPS